MGGLNPLTPFRYATDFSSVENRDISRLQQLNVNECYHNSGVTRDTLHLRCIAIRKESVPEEMASDQMEKQSDAFWCRMQKEINNHLNIDRNLTQLHQTNSWTCIAVLVRV